LQFYYDRKKGLFKIKSKQDVQPVKKEQENTQTKELNESDVKVEDKNVEADKGLKDIYKKMSKDLFNEEELAPEEISQNEEQPVKALNKDVNIEQKANLNLANPLATLAIAINDHLLYGDKGLIGYRPLETDEKAIIEESGKGVIAQLDYIEDPKVRYLFYSYAVPAVARIDLFIDKAISAIKNRNKFKANKPANNNTINTPVEINTKTLTMTDEQKAYIENLKAAGVNVDPAFDFSKDIDTAAYRDRKIFRNLGSGYGD